MSVVSLDPDGALWVDVFIPLLVKNVINSLGPHLSGRVALKLIDFLLTNPLRWV
jgi:hypothetical protein